MDSLFSSEFRFGLLQNTLIVGSVVMKKPKQNRVSWSDFRCMVVLEQKHNSHTRGQDAGKVCIIASINSHILMWVIAGAHKFFPSAEVVAIIHKLNWWWQESIGICAFWLSSTGPDSQWKLVRSSLPPSPPPTGWTIPDLLWLGISSEEMALIDCAEPVSLVVRSHDRSRSPPVSASAMILVYFFLYTYGILIRSFCGCGPIWTGPSVRGGRRTSESVPRPAQLGQIRIADFENITVNYVSFARDHKSFCYFFFGAVGRLASDYFGYAFAGIIRPRFISCRWMN